MSDTSMNLNHHLLCASIFYLKIINMYGQFIYNIVYLLPVLDF